MVKGKAARPQPSSQNYCKLSIVKNSIDKVCAQAKFLQFIKQIGPLDLVECLLVVERKQKGCVLTAL